MKKRLLLLLLTLIPFTSWAHIPAQTNGQSTPSLAPMLKKVTPGVVNILVEKKITLSPNPHLSIKDLRKNIARSMAIGSGVVINAKNGLIITNAHVVKDEKLIVVTLKDGQRYHANLVGKDDGFDIAIIHIKAKNLTAIPLADSNKLQVGNFVAAIGSPFGLTQTVTSGVISALNRSEPKIEGFQSFIQTDAPINPGNSGGALVNLQGQLIGMNTAIITPNYGNIGIGFSIPSNMIKSVVTQLLKYGKVERGMLGVIAQNISATLANAFHLEADRGVIITTVIPGSAAQKAGIRLQDVILEVNQSKIHNAVQLRNTLGIMRPGTPLKILVLRNHHTTVLKGAVGDPKKIQTKHKIPFIGGMRLQDFHEIEADGSLLLGALVTGLSLNSAGMLAGILPGDVITAANNKTIRSAKMLEAIAKRHKKPLLLTVSRGHGNLFMVIAPD